MRLTAAVDREYPTTPATTSATRQIGADVVLASKKL